MNFVYVTIISVVFFGVGVGCTTPVIVCQQMITEDAHVAQAEGQAATVSGIAGRGRIADQANPIAVRVQHP